MKLLVGGNGQICPLRPLRSIVSLDLTTSLTKLQIKGSARFVQTPAKEDVSKYSSYCWQISPIQIPQIMKQRITRATCIEDCRKALPPSDISGQRIEALKQLELFDAKKIVFMCQCASHVPVCILQKVRYIFYEISVCP